MKRPYQFNMKYITLTRPSLLDIINKAKEIEQVPDEFIFVENGIYSDEIELVWKEENTTYEKDMQEYSKWLKECELKETEEKLKRIKKEIEEL